MRRYPVVVFGHPKNFRISVRGYECTLYVPVGTPARIISVAGVPVEEIPDVQVVAGTGSVWHIVFPVKAGVTATDFTVVAV